MGCVPTLGGRCKNSVTPKTGGAPEGAPRSTAFPVLCEPASARRDGLDLSRNGSPFTAAFPIVGAGDLAAYTSGRRVEATGRTGAKTLVIGGLPGLVAWLRPQTRDARSAANA